MDKNVWKILAVLSMALLVVVLVTSASYSSSNLDDVSYSIEQVADELDDIEEQLEAINGNLEYLKYLKSIYFEL